MADKNRVPNQKEIKQLPRWAQVAFAARCARRVQPIFALAWPEVSKKDIETIEAAVSASETAASQAYSEDVAFSFANAAAEVFVSRRNAFLDKAPSKSTNAAFAAAISETARVAGRAAHTAATALAPSKAVKSFAFRAFVTAKLAAETTEIFGGEKLRTDVVLAFWQDFYKLLKMSKDKKWDDNTYVGPEVFDSLWPEGTPPNWLQIKKHLCWSDQCNILERIYKLKVEYPVLEIYLNPGAASKQTIQEVFDSLNSLHHVAGGLGYEFRNDGHYVYAVEGANLEK